MQTIRTRRHEVRTTRASGLGSLTQDCDLVNLIQCSYAFSPAFGYLNDIAAGFNNPYDALKDVDIYEVDMPFGRDGGFALGSKIGPIRRMIKNPFKMPCIVTVSHDVDEESRFVMAIDFISRVNVALSGHGYMVALMDLNGKIIDLIDHIADEDCAYEAQKFLYDAAISLEDNSIETNYLRKLGA